MIQVVSKWSSNEIGNGNSTDSKAFSPVDKVHHLAVIDRRECFNWFKSALSF